MKFCSVAITKGVMPALIKDSNAVVLPVPLSPKRITFGANPSDGSATIGGPVGTGVGWTTAFIYKLLAMCFKVILELQCQYRHGFPALVHLVRQAEPNPVPYILALQDAPEAIAWRHDPDAGLVIDSCREALAAIHAIILVVKRSP